MIRRAAIALAFVVVALFAAAPAFAVGPGVITGTVLPASVAPEVEVCVVEARPSELCTAPDPSGSYKLTGVPVGLQRVEFLPSHRSGYLPQYFDHKSRLEEATTIGIGPESEVEGVDAELELGSTIEGTVRAASGGSPLADVEVCVQGAGTGITFGCSSTGASGAYVIGALPAGLYKAGFRGRGSSAEYAPQFYDGVEALNGATAITVLPASSVTGIDAELAVGARVEGTVTAASTGAPLAGIPVCLFAVAAVTPAQCVFSELAGAYSLLGIPAGDYQVGFSLGAGELGSESVSEGSVSYLPQYYDGVAVRSGSSTLSLGQGQVWRGADAALLPVLRPAPIAPSSPLASAPASPVQIFGEPVPPKKRKCRRAARRKAAKTRLRCVNKQRRKEKGRHRRHHRVDSAP